MGLSLGAHSLSFSPSMDMEEPIPREQKQSSSWPWGDYSLQQVTFEGKQSLPPQNLPHWDADYFEKQDAGRIFHLPMNCQK